MHSENDEKSHLNMKTCQSWLLYLDSIKFHRGWGYLWRNCFSVEGLLDLWLLVKLDQNSSWNTWKKIVLRYLEHLHDDIKTEIFKYFNKFESVLDILKKYFSKTIKIRYQSGFIRGPNRQPKIWKWNVSKTINCTQQAILLVHSRNGNATQSGSDAIK